MYFKDRCTLFSLLDVCVLESQQLVTLKGRKQPLQFPVSSFFFGGVGGWDLYFCAYVYLLGEGAGKGLFQIDLIHSLGKGCLSYVGISKIISL